MSVVIAAYFTYCQTLKHWEDNDAHAVEREKMNLDREKFYIDKFGRMRPDGKCFWNRVAGLACVRKLQSRVLTHGCGDADGNVIIRRRV